MLKQDLKKDFTEYKHDADRKEMLRDYYYSVVEDPGKLEYAMLYCVDRDRDHDHCLLCHMPKDLITYTVRAFRVVHRRMSDFFACSCMSRAPYIATM